MIEENDALMMAALDRFVARYGPRPATRLAELIRDRQRADELASALETAAARARKVRTRPKAQRTARVGISVLNQLRLSDPEKHAVIAEIRRQLVSRTILPSMGELRRFSRMHGLSIGKSSSRDAAIAPFLRSLSQLSISEINSLRESIIQSDVDDRSLVRWREVIVRSQPAESKAADRTREGTSRPEV